jgi:hypothetical protein
MAKDSHVIMDGLPPHSTHITQPLDVVGLMKPMKDYMTRALSTLQVQSPWERYTEQDVIRLLCSPGTMPKGDRNWSPFAKAFTPHNIKSAFAQTWLWPVDYEHVRCA